jgi:hypothetical protein
MLSSPTTKARQGRAPYSWAGCQCSRCPTRSDSRARVKPKMARSGRYRADMERTRIFEPSPYSERRAILNSFELDGRYWRTPQTFDDGEALWEAVCVHELEGSSRSCCVAVTCRVSAAGSRQEPRLRALRDRARGRVEDPARTAEFGSKLPRARRSPPIGLPTACRRSSPFPRRPRRARLLRTRTSCRSGCRTATASRSAPRR